MDQDMIAYFDERFRETAQQISSLREDTTQQISSLREDTTQQISSLREETMQRFEKVETAIRHTHVLLEAVRDDTHLIAEGVVGMGERLDTFQAHQSHRLDEELDAIKLNLRDLNRRVAIVEGHNDRETTDVMTLIRQRWIKTQAAPPLPPPLPSGGEVMAEGTGG